MTIAAEVEALFAKGRSEDALHLAQNHYSKGLDMLIAALDYTGKKQACFQLTMEALRIRCEGPKPTYPALSRKERVMISGFFYSGSGAVLDHLRSYQGAVKWPPRGEYRFIKSPGGLHKFVDAATGGGDFMQAVIDLYLNVSGAKILRPETPSKASWKTAIKASRNLQKLDTADAHHKELFQLRSISF